MKQFGAIPRVAQFGHPAAVQLAYFQVGGVFEFDVFATLFRNVGMVGASLQKTSRNGY